MRIGFFDSGLGGLLVMEHCIKQKPHHEYVFLGDTKYLPYGPRSTEEIIEYSFPCITFLLEHQQCDLVIIACNTISVRAVKQFQEKYPQYRDMVIGIDIPTLSYLRNIDSEEVLTISTIQTKESGRYSSFSKEVIAMPGLVELIENSQKETAMHMCDDVLAHHHEIANLFLGCTHYLWLCDDLKEKYPDIHIIRQDEIVCELIPDIQKDKFNVEYFLTSHIDEYIKKYQKDFKLVFIPR